MGFKPWLNQRQGLVAARPFQFAIDSPPNGRQEPSEAISKVGLAEMANNCKRFRVESSNVVAHLLCDLSRRRLCVGLGNVQVPYPSTPDQARPREFCNVAGFLMLYLLQSSGYSFFHFAQRYSSGTLCSHGDHLPSGRP